MTLQEMKKKVLGLIEELNPNSELLTDDPDISTKINEVINQLMFEMARMKKLPRYVKLEVSAGDTIEFADIEKKCGNEIYQVALVTGVNYIPRADGTVCEGGDHSGRKRRLDVLGRDLCAAGAKPRHRLPAAFGRGLRQILRASPRRYLRTPDGR